jgi:replicative DNA helicase
LHFDTPILALQQLSRGIERREGNKVPRLDDLANSGQVEADADNVWLLLRPAAYVDDETSPFFSG